MASSAMHETITNSPTRIVNLTAQGIARRVTNGLAAAQNSDIAQQVAQGCYLGRQLHIQRRDFKVAGSFNIRMNRVLKQRRGDAGDHHYCEQRHLQA
jgi:hypothetical protein